MSYIIQRLCKVAVNSQWMSLENYLLRKSI